MKLWLIKRSDKYDYDEYDSAVVVSHSMDDARRIHPNGNGKVTPVEAPSYFDWTSLANVLVEEIGLARDGLTEGTVICASFNAG